MQLFLLVPLALLVALGGGFPVAEAKLSGAKSPCQLALERGGPQSQGGRSEFVQRFSLETQKFLYPKPGEPWGHHRLVAEVQYWPFAGRFDLQVKLVRLAVDLEDWRVPLQVKGAFFVPQRGQPGYETATPEGVVVAHQDPSKLGSQWTMLFTGEAFRREVEMGGIPLLEEAGPYDIIHCPKPGEDMSKVQAAILTRVPEERTGGQRHILICF